MNIRKALAILITECDGVLCEAERQCGGDGEGCAAYRGYYSSPERRWKKCGNCPMDLVADLREPLAAAREALGRERKGMTT